MVIKHTKFAVSALAAAGFLLLSVSAQAQRPTAAAVIEACSVSAEDCQSAIDAFIGDSFLSAQRAIDLARRIAWAVEGDRAEDFALQSFAAVVVRADFSNATLGMILSQAESASTGSRDLLTAALSELEVGSPN